MKGPELLKQHVGHLKTRMGAAFPGSRAVFRGHDIHADLKDMDWVELFVFGITGRRFTEAQIELLHAIWVYTSYPDARLWNNRVAALAGSTRSTGNLGVAAALAVSEASIYGRGIDIRASRFLHRSYARIAAGEELASCVKEELATHRGIAGYGRPIAAGDERLKPTMALAQRLGLGDGPYVKLAYQIEQALIAGRWRWRMNYAGLLAGLTADMGLSPTEHYLYLFPAFLAGMPPCFIEASEKAEGTLFPLRCDAIDYQGAARRAWR